MTEGSSDRSLWVKAVSARVGLGNQYIVEQKVKEEDRTRTCEIGIEALGNGPVL